MQAATIHYWQKQIAALQECEMPTSPIGFSQESMDDELCTERLRAGNTEVEIFVPLFFFFVDHSFPRAAF